MKITNRLVTPLTGEPIADNRGVKSGPATGSEATQSVDVHLSDLAGQLQAIQARLASGEVVDAAKIAEIRQAIAEGRLRIHPDAIAEKLLDSVRDLLASPRRD